MKNIDKKIEEALAKADPKNNKSIQEAANMILAEDIGAGDIVSTVHDKESYPYAGQKATVVEVKDNGWSRVRLPDGTVVPVQTSLLIKV